MSIEGRTIPYQADRTSYYAVALPLLLLVLLEGGAFFAAGCFAEISLRMRLVHFGAGILSLLVPAWTLTAPLRTRHRLTSEALHLHFGKRRLTIPPDAIRSVVAAQHPLEPMDPLRMHRDAEHARIVGLFSERGHLELQLEGDRMTLPKWATGATSVLISVDEPAALCEALAGASRDDGAAAPTAQRCGL